ncbi:MAG: hypothetical protein R3C16_06930 [Hyphomonadaceae bacterium]
MRDVKALVEMRAFRWGADVERYVEIWPGAKIKRIYNRTKRVKRRMQRALECERQIARILNIPEMESCDGMFLPFKCEKHSFTLSFMRRRKEPWVLNFAHDYTPPAKKKPRSPGESRAATRKPAAKAAGKRSVKKKLAAVFVSYKIAVEPMFRPEVHAGYEGRKKLTELRRYAEILSLLRHAQTAFFTAMDGLARAARRSAALPYAIASAIKEDVVQSVLKPAGRGLESGLRLERRLFAPRSVCRSACALGFRQIRQSTGTPCRLACVRTNRAVVAMRSVKELRKKEASVRPNAPRSIQPRSARQFRVRLGDRAGR